MSEESRPGSVGDVLGDAGPCPVVNWAGKAYRVGRPTPHVLARVELEVARLATEEQKALREVLDPEDAAELKAEHHRGLLGRSHRAGGPQWNATFGTPAGQLLILWACVAEHHSEFAPADAARMAAEAADDVEAALLIVAPDFFRIVGRAASARPDRVEEQIARFQARREKTPPR